MGQLGYNRMAPQSYTFKLIKELLTMTRLMTLTGVPRRLRLRRAKIENEL